MLVEHQHQLPGQHEQGNNEADLQICGRLHCLIGRHGKYATFVKLALLGFV